jgi:hypothetical protein
VPEFDVLPPMAMGIHAVLIDRRERHAAFEGARVTDLRDLPALLGVGE